MGSVRPVIQKDELVRAARGMSAYLLSQPVVPLFISVMNGAGPWSVLFKSVYDRLSPSPSRFCQITASSYKGTKSTGQVHLKVEPHIVHALRSAAKRGDLAVVLEDVIETGKTMEAVVSYLIDLGFCSDRIVIMTMLHKRRIYAGPPLLVGPFRLTSASVATWPAFEVSLDSFVVGFGLDLDGEYRDLDHIGIYTPDSGDQP